jgi:hypothetical protein
MHVHIWKGIHTRGVLSKRHSVICIVERNRQHRGLVRRMYVISYGIPQKKDEVVFLALSLRQLQTKCIPLLELLLSARGRDKSSAYIHRHRNYPTEVDRRMRGTQRGWGTRLEDNERHSRPQLGRVTTAPLPTVGSTRGETSVAFSADLLVAVVF